MKKQTQSELNTRLVNLACDAMFIFASKRDEIIAQLDELSEENPHIDVIDIFRQEEILTDEKIEYLLAFNTHMGLQVRDQQFGRIAVANGMVPREDVTQALEYQKSCFEKNSINIRIGEILVENSRISETDRLSILLTQNRIKNRHLADAFNEMGETRGQKDDINKRFGAFAIKKGLATAGQVVEALKLQAKERSGKDSPRFISEILRETAGMAGTEVEEILVLQKQFEKRRLDLEKALYTPQAELKVFKRLDKYFSSTLSGDGIEGYAKKIKEPKTEIPCYEFIIWLQRVGIRFGIVSDDELEAFILDGAVGSRITVAKGYPPTDTTHESVKFYFGAETASSAGRPDNTETSDPDSPESDPPESEPGDSPEKEEYKEKEEPADEEKEPATAGEKQAALPITRGGILARIIPGSEGKPGKSVLGNPIRPEAPAPSPLNAGSGVIRRGPDFFARSDGYPVLKNGTTLVVEPLEKAAGAKTIRGNIDSDTEDKYASAAITLSGTITSEAVLNCDSLDLKGALLGRVTTTGGIQVDGDIGRSGAECRPEVFSSGSVRAGKAVINADIQTGGEFLAFNSTVSGSQITARGGMTLKNVVKGGQGPSVLRFGLKPGDRLLTLDITIDRKIRELSVLRKEEEIAVLTRAYEKDVEEIETRQCEQTVLTTLAAIIEAPELYQYDGLEGKLTYLYDLPDFSSVKTFYLKLPESESAEKFLDRIKADTAKMDMDQVLKHIKKKIDPGPGNEEDDEAEPGTPPAPAMPDLERVEREFRLRLAALETEVEDNEADIQKLENEIKGLKALTIKEASARLPSIPRSTAAVKIKNKCEKGTVIKGRAARMTVPKTVYHVKFKEVVTPGTRTAAIVIEAY